MRMIARESLVPVLIGWLISVWLPVPAPVRSMAGAAAAAVVDGMHAVASTLAPDAQAKR